SSASRDSESGVKPTRSAKSTETSRLSAAGAEDSTGPCAEARATACRAEPHSPQNFSLPSMAAPQEEHARARGEPHSVQNFLPSWFSARQLGHSIVVGGAYFPWPGLDEPVADAGLREYVARAGGVGLDFPTQVRDVDV